MTKKLLLGVLLLPCGVAVAQPQATPAPTAAVQPPVVADPAGSSPAWLREHGIVSTEDVIALLGISPTVEQRQQIEKAVVARNAALEKANNAMAAQLRATLAANDAELARRVADQKERDRLKTISRRQPGRYNGMKNQK